MFDGGACTVTVCDSYGNTQLWSGTLGLGETSPQFNDGKGSECQVSVDASGVVTYSNLGGLTSDVSGSAVTVTPQYDVSALQTRMIGLWGNPSISGQSGTGVDAWAANTKLAGTTSGATDLAIDAATGACTPSEADFAASANAVASMLLWEGI